MSSPTGHLLIGQRVVAGSAPSFHAINPVTGQAIEPAFTGAGAADIDEACSLAQTAFDAFRSTAPEQRALFLEEIADGIEALGPSLIDRAMTETGLARGRLEAERGRTMGQLRLFARVLRAGLWQEATVDPAMPERQPPRPDLRTRRIGIGPVAVFGASNFPLAFSVAGGDTACAFAAGCPVIVKAHPSHPGTCELVGRVVQRAVRNQGFPAGTFSMVSGQGHDAGARLASHHAVQAIAFTGSRSGGLALSKIARERPEPIPVYAEMSSINPVFLLPGALESRAETIAANYIASLTQSSGCLCTNPGLTLGIAGAAWDRFVGAVSRHIEPHMADTLLNGGIHRAYLQGTQRIASTPGTRLVGRGQAASAAFAAPAVVHEVMAVSFLKQPVLQEEVFGPSGLLVRCDDFEQMRAVAEKLEGQLAAAMHLEDVDHALAKSLLPTLERKAGRILVNGFPTGVEVGHAMVHGGPFPATSDARSTSVGARAIDRFLRPICYQDVPDALLPAELRHRPAQTRWRLVEGEPARA